MQLLSLTVDNLGVFRGRHRLDFHPLQSADEGSARNLTVVSGENGAGKSTLFKALGLALHGSLALGSKVSRQAYNNFLLNRLHRQDYSGATVTSDGGGVSLSFRYVRSGQPTVVEVHRRWTRSGGSVSESLTVSCDGKPPEVDSSDYQAWLNDLIPPGLGPLCFFDAEMLDTLAMPERRGGELLGETLRRLLGLDLVGRLQDDLAQYTVRSGGGNKTERLRKEVLEHQTAVEELDAYLEQLRSNAEALEQEQTELEAALEQQERRLTAEGGNYAARRPELQDRHSAILEETEAVAEQLHELSSGLLPFALVPGLCRTLAEKLTQEAKLHRQEVADELWQERVSDMESVLQDDDLWQDLDLPPDTRRAVAQRVAHLLQETNPPTQSGRQSFVHRLAEPEHDRLQDWISQALHSVPQQAQSLGERLRGLRNERRSIEDELRRAPEDEVLEPIHAEISRLQTSLNEVRQRQKTLSEKLGATEFQREERDRQRERAAEQIAEAQAGERQLALAERSRQALRTYQDALTRQRLEALEEALVESFNAICHKEHLLNAASFDPNTFEVQLEDVNGHALEVNDFSAGERQLYALALLQALRRVSKRQLPLAVDTPLARLDEAHRESFIHRYVPEASDQVFLFATDAEMDADTLAQAEPYLARLYRLHHDPQRSETRIIQDEQSATGSPELIPLASLAEE